MSYTRKMHSPLLLLAILMLLLHLGTVAAAENVLNMPSSLEVIEAESFRGLEAVDEVILPDGTVSIGELAFADSSLSRITIPASVQSIAANAFSNTAPVTFVCEENSFADSYAFSRGWETEYLNGNLRMYLGTKNVPVEGAVRLLRFTAPYTTTLTVYSTGGGDTYGYLYNDQMQTLVTNDDGGEGHNFRYSYSVVKNRDYYIGVRYYNASEHGTISVTASLPNLSIAFDSEELLMEAGTTTTIVPQICTIYSEYQLTWSSSDPSVAVVEDGRVTALRNGIATINVTITAGDERATADCYLSVYGENEYIAEVVYNGHTYRLYDDGYTWTSAQNFCAQMGGHLAVITTEGEQNVVWDLIRANGARNNYWIGGYRYNAAWYWITGESFEYTNWSPGQPDNNWIGEDSLEIYRVENPYDSRSIAGRWNDLNNLGLCKNEQDFFGMDHFGFVCEWEETLR